MVKLLVWKIVLVGVVLAWLSQAAGASEPVVPAKKSECPEECQRRAKAAFAFAKLKAEAATKPAPTVAPMPKPAAPKVGKLCPCGDNCQCESGTCPSHCPVSNVGGFAQLVKSTNQAQPPKAVPVVKSGHWEQRCSKGGCYWVWVED